MSEGSPSGVGHRCQDSVGQRPSLVRQFAV